MFIKNFDHLMELAKEKEKKKIVVAAAEGWEFLNLVYEAEKMELAEFILIGNKAKIEEILEEKEISIKTEVIDEKDHKKAAELAVQLVRDGKAGVIMKGMLHTSVILRAVLDKEKGLHAGQHISQCTLFEKNNEDGLMIMSDCAITTATDLETKSKVVQNAIGLAHDLGYVRPNVALLTSLEVINPKMQDTIDAASLSKMAERGQIVGANVDGPLAMDNAVSKKAAEMKGVTGPVAGNADILIMPDLTSGNIACKVVTFIAEKINCDAILGLKVPVVMNSRSQTTEGKLMSIALATYLS